jgi:acyl-CoA thioesterase FadM
MNAMADPHQVAGRVSTPLENTPARPWDPAAAIAAPLSLHSPTVLPQWVDYNGHMSESCFLLVFGDSSDAFFRYIGIDETYRDSGGHSLYTVETHIHNIREASEGEPLRLTLQLLDADYKRLHIFHTMYHGTSGDILATGEQMLVHVNMAQGSSAPMPPDLQQRVNAILSAHSALPRPKQAGASIGIRRKT